MPEEYDVLRTIYLPREVDENIRIIAFHRKIAKGALMLEYIERGMANDASDNPVVRKIVRETRKNG
jgi:hypothetical protein